MNRRELLRASLLGATLAPLGPLRGAPNRPSPNGQSAGVANRSGRFKLKYAPHFGMFRHHAGDSLVDQLQFIANEGFVALEDNAMAGRPVETQERLAREMTRWGIEMGVFVAHAPWGRVTFASAEREATDEILKDIRAAVEVAKRVNASWCTVVPGELNPGLEWDYQSVHVVDNLKRCAEILEPAGLTAVLEPLNHFIDHPRLFLTRVPQAYRICREVGSPAVKILDDLYHQQITEGNLLPNLDRAWDEIAYIQVGDNPGRKEPTTGEINYKNVFAHLHSKGWQGIVGMEHGNSRPGRAGERALIDAYVEVDSFPV